ncbi:MAG TPA: hypothetical protein VLH60_02045, partial [Sedimentisphaerales bacterium]|nr:hypothetical protein [Sedimentisphaerales bacterium]
RLLTAAYSAATTTADVRIWSALPKNFQVASIPMPPDGRLTIMTPSNRAYPLVIKPCEYAIVYVKMRTALDEPIIEVIRY